jgi:hypothetical protein
MPLTYLDSVMIEVPAAIATLSTVNLTADNFFTRKINAINADFNIINTDTLNAPNIINVTLDNNTINTGQVNANTLYASNIQATNALINNTSINNASIVNVNSTNLNSDTGTINNFRSNLVNTNTLSAYTGTIDNFTSDNITSDNITAGNFYVDKIYKNLTNVLYVSIGGNDTNTGTNIFNSLRTIKKACEIAHNARVASNNNPNVKFTIFVNTGDYVENNPVYVPPNVSIIGDNLRRVSIKPLNRQEDILWLDNSSYVWGVTFRSHFAPSAATAFPDASNARLSAIAFRNCTTPLSGWIRPYIITSPYVQGSSSITSGLSSRLQGSVNQVINNTYTNGVQASTAITNCFNTVTDIMLYGPNSVAPYSGVSTTGSAAASALIAFNTDFIKAEVSSFVIEQYPALASIPNMLTTCQRDIGYILSAVCVDITNGNNNASIQSGQAYWNGVTSVLPQDQIAPTISTVQFAKRLSQHIVKNESIPVLNAGMGMRVDGSKVEGFTRSMVLDSFTQFNENGHGIYIINNGYAQLVSIFTICCDEAVTVESGGVCSISTSNCSFGLSGIVARGKSTSPLLSGTIIRALTTPDNPLTTKSILMRGVVGLDIYPDSPYYPSYLNNPAIGLDTRKVSFKPYDNLVFTNNTGNTGDLYTITGNPTLTSIGGQDHYIIDIIESTAVDTFVPNTSAAFFLRSTAYPSSHTFEFVGSGVVLKDSVPSLGGKANPDNEVVFEDGGIVFYTSTNHTGDFSIGKDFRVVQSTGTIEGDTFKRSILTLVSPLNLALGE